MQVKHPADFATGNDSDADTKQNDNCGHHSPLGNEHRIVCQMDINFDFICHGIRNCIPQPFLSLSCIDVERRTQIVSKSHFRFRLELMGDMNIDSPVSARFDNRNGFVPRNLKRRRLSVSIAHLSPKSNGNCVQFRYGYRDAPDARASSDPPPIPP